MFPIMFLLLLWMRGTPTTRVRPDNVSYHVPTIALGERYSYDTLDQIMFPIMFLLLLLVRGTPTTC